MSGGTVGSITTDSDTDLPPPQAEAEAATMASAAYTYSRRPPKPTEKRRLLSLRHLNCLALMIVLSSIGLVRLGDFAFLLFSIIYTFFLSRFAFPPSPPPTAGTGDHAPPPIFSPDNKILPIYITVAAIIGLYLPIAYILEGIYVGDKEGIKAAAPHLFLLASQIFMEGVFFTDHFGIPVRVFVPVSYNTKRVFEILDWLRSELLKAGSNSQTETDSSRRRLHLHLLVGRALAVANLAFWCFNLFGFLIPVYIPRAFKRYYSTTSKAH
ncbi:hypothetical protein Dimus_000247 [Dionaea muscipula]